MIGSRGDGPLELTDTALKLSKVIEREAKRRSALRHSPIFRVQANISTFRRNSVSSITTNRSKRSTASIMPAPPESFTENNRSMSRGPKMTTIEPQRDSFQSNKPSEMTSEDDEPIGTPKPVGCAQAIWLLVDDPQSSQAAYVFSIAVFAFIIISTIVFIAQTETSLDKFSVELGYIETICAAMFTFEFAVRILFCPSKCDFIKNFANWIDIASIFPYYLENIMSVENASSFGAIRIVRLTRVARVLKMSRYSSAIQVFVQAITISMKPLSMLMFLMSIAMIVFASMIYFAEYTSDGCRKGGWVGNCINVAEADRFYAVNSVMGAAQRVISASSCICVDPNPYNSIASSFWWCIVTMSTVGYGDMTPVTIAGKIVGCTTVLTGMLVLALPITVIGTNFQKVMKSMMHQTMKTNVDYLRGKRMICRNEIEAILQRFHAVIEDIHLDIDDVINVYDTDNSGMLEDEELARFRHDLEMLQNHAFMNQHLNSGLGLHHGSTSGPSSHSSFHRQPMCEPSGDSISAFTRRRGSIGTLMSGPTAFQAPSIKLVQGKSQPGSIETPEQTDSSQSNHMYTSSTPLSPARGEELKRARSVSDAATPMWRPQARVVDEELLMMRLYELQRAWEDRLLETEQRLEAKLNNLTKILMRMENMLELDD